MTSIYKIFAPILCLTCILISCKHNNIEKQLGDELCTTIVEDFKQSIPDDGELDFNISSNILTAKISGNTKWEIVIKARESGAIKRYFGNSSYVNVVWNGESDSVLYFKKGDHCDIYFNTMCKESIVRHVVLKEDVQYSKFGFAADQIEGSGTPSSNVVYLHGSADINQYETTNSPQGNSYYHIKVDHCPTQWYLGDYTVSNLLNKVGNSLGTNDPNDIYINVLANTNNVQSGCMLQIGQQGPHGTNSLKFEAKKGWYMYSAKLSDLGITNPNKIVNVTILLQPSVEYGPIDFSLDMIMFTKGKPL